MAPSYLHQCRQCGLQYWHPVFNPGADWYESSNQYDVSERLGLHFHKAYHRTFARRQQGRIRGPLLDVGCGTGAVVHFAERQGQDGWGVDFDRRAIDIARRHFGLKNVSTDPLELFLRRPGLPAFSVITMFEVLEHLDRPADVIDQLAGAIAPEGPLVISTPNRDRYLVNASSWDFPPHHLTRWDLPTLTSLLERAGFRVRHAQAVDEFRMLMAACNERTTMNVVSRVASGAPGAPGYQALVRLSRFAAQAKEWIIGGIPAAGLLGMSRITGRTNGTLYVEAVKARTSRS